MKLLSQVGMSLAVLVSLPVHAGQDVVATGGALASKVILNGFHGAPQMTPVPEPSQWGFFVFAAFVGIVAIRKFRSKLPARS